MFRDFCYLYRKLPQNDDNDGSQDSSSDGKGGVQKLVDPIQDEFRIFKLKQLRLDEIYAEAKKQGRSPSLFVYDPDDDNLQFGLDIALKIHKRVNLF